MSPAALGAFAWAGRTIDEACAASTAGVSGFECLQLTRADIDDPGAQARLCALLRKTHRVEDASGVLRRYVAAGYTGDRLVHAVQGAVV